MEHLSHPVATDRFKYSPTHLNCVNLQFSDQQQQSQPHLSLNQLCHAAIICVNSTVMMVPAGRCGGGRVGTERCSDGCRGVSTVWGGSSVCAVRQVLHACGFVHGQHVHQSTPLRLQFLDLGLQVLILVFKDF